MATVSTVIVCIIILLVVVWTLFRHGKKGSDGVVHSHEGSVGEIKAKKSTKPYKPAPVEPTFQSFNHAIKPLTVTEAIAEPTPVPVQNEVHLSEQDIFVQSMISKAQQDSVAISQGEPHQAEILFEDEEKPTWNHLIKESFEKRVKKTPEPKAAETVQTTPEQQSMEPLVMPSSLLMIHIMAPRARSFTGESILQVCNRRGLKHGEREMFHSYAINGKALYSVVSAVRPGGFPIQAMETFKTPGLSVVMDMALLDQPRSVFKSMLETAHVLAEELSGDVLDERHERLTALTVSDYLARIKTYASLRQHHERSEA